jgi:hypothetical protein
MGEARASRDEWRKRVERWKDSGLTAKEFAAETGLNAGTLQFWRYKLKKTDAVGARRRSPAVVAPAVSSIVEVAATRTAVDPRVEIELRNGRLLRVPASFESSALKALLAILEAA